MKKKITMQELKSLIKEEASKLHRRALLESEKKKLMEELIKEGEYRVLEFNNFRKLIEAFKSEYPNYYNSYEAVIPGYFNDLVEAVESGVNMKEWAENYASPYEREVVHFFSSSLFFGKVVGVWTFRRNDISYGASSTRYLNWDGDENKGKLIAGLHTYGHFDPMTFPLNENDEKEFIPMIGMIAGNQTDGLGYKGTIEHVGDDYFVLRNTKKGTEHGPVLIKPSQYFRFKEWGFHLPDNGRSKDFDDMMGNPLDNMDF